MDVSHELGALRFVVDSSLSSKVAKFNQQVDQHKQSQLLNPFSNADGRASPKPSFSKDEYGKPLAGSLTEMRGQKANIHVLKEMLELCQIIDSEGYNVKDEPNMRVIPFGELFNIYNYISDKVVGILLRARKHKIVEFEGEMLFQRRDDDVPIFLLKPVHEIRREMEDKIEGIKRCGSPAPQATSVLLDRSAHGLGVPKGATPRSSVSRTPSPQTSKSGTPVRETKLTAAKLEKSEGVLKPEVAEKKGVVKAEVIEKKPIENEISVDAKPIISDIVKPTQSTEKKEEIKLNGENVIIEQQLPTVIVQSTTCELPTAVTETKMDVNNNDNNTNDDLPTIIIEATAVYEGPAKTVETIETNNSVPISSGAAPAQATNKDSNATVESTVSV